VALPENVTCEQCILQVNKISRRKFKKLLKTLGLLNLDVFETKKVIKVNIPT